MSTREQAERDLRDWAANNARRDKVVLAALAAGVEKKRVHELTGIARTTINRIEGKIMGRTKPQNWKGERAYVTAFVDALLNEELPRSQRYEELRDAFWWLTSPWGVSRTEGKALLVAEVRRRSPRTSEDEAIRRLDEIMGKAYAEVDPGN